MKARGADHFVKLKSLVMSLFGMGIIVTAFLVAMYCVDKNAVDEHEAAFNEQQALQVFLVKQSLQAELDEIARHTQIMTTFFTRTYNNGGPEFLDRSDAVRLFPAIDGNILGQFFVVQGQEQWYSAVSDEDYAGLLKRLARTWAEDAELYLRESNAQYYIPAFYAKETVQLMGVVRRVSLNEGAHDGVLVFIANLRPMLDRYVKPMRSGKYGAGYLLDGEGTIVYDHEEEIVGRNVFDGMHDKYPLLLKLDHRLVSETSGESSYSFTVKRGGKISRKLIAWNAAEIGSKKLVVCLSAPDIEINENLDLVHFYNILLVAALGVALIAMSIGIFHRRKTEELAQSERLFRRFTDAAWEGILMHEKGIILEGNDQLWEMLGYEPDKEELPHNVYDLVAEEYRSEVKKLVDGVDPNPYETMVLRRDGTSFPIAVRVREMEYGGRLVRVVAIRDISERKQTEEELKSFNAQLEDLVEERTLDLAKQNAALEKANQQLQEMDRKKSEFLSAVSHELRTPMTAILGFAKLIERDLKKICPLEGEPNQCNGKADRAKDNTAIIIEEGERLTRLINDVLDLSRIEGGRQQWNDRTFPLTEVVEGAVRTTAPLFGEGDVRLVASVDNDLPDVHMDRDCLHQVLFNLLDNAAKFTEQGKVEVSVSRPSGGGLRVEVRDTGPGIPEDELDDVFSKFYQARGGDTITDKPKGTGLGLAICDNIVRHYGGSIHVESAIGEGCTFIVEFPEAVVA